MPESRERRMLWVLYLLGAYVLAQVFWWGFLLVRANQELLQLKAQVEGTGAPDPLRAYKMITGEGVVFIVLLLIGLYWIKRTISRELRLNRMERTFLLSVTHELKTPIAAIKLFLETLQNRSLAAEKQQSMIVDALRETSRLQGLSENILLAARLDGKLSQENHQGASWSDIVIRETNRFKRLFESERKFNTQLTEGLMVRGDEELLRAIIFNLLENAVKYSPANSEISIQLTQKGTNAELRVADQGPGIPADEMNRIFDMFYRMGNESTRKHKGTGLGLYIARSSVRLHDGTIYVESNPGGGSVFIVAIPLQKIT